MQKIAINIGESFLGSSGHFLSDLPGLGRLVSILLSNAIVIAGVTFLILTIIGGLTMISKGGESPQEIAKGKDIILAALMGFIIVIIAYWIVRIVEVATGLRILG